jgi:hypothetical protein
MVVVGVVVHLFLRHRVDIVEASGESLPGYGVGVNISGVCWGIQENPSPSKR